MDINLKDKNPTLQIRANNKRSTGEGVIGLLEEIITRNTSKSDALKIHNLRKEYDKGFYLARTNEFHKAKNVFDKTDATLHSLFHRNSFEFYCIQLLAIPPKSYLAFKVNQNNIAISLTKRSIEYAMLLQDYPSSRNLGLYISQMLTNLAQTYMVSNEIEYWRKTALENIHFLANFTLPRNCQDFKIENLKKASIRYFVLIDAINDALISIVKYRGANGREFINSIHFNDVSDPIITQINVWKTLNFCLNQQNTETEFFQKGYHSFLEYEDGIYDLRYLKLFLKNRIKKERIQLHNSVEV